MFQRDELLMRELVGKENDRVLFHRSVFPIGVDVLKLETPESVAAG